MRRTRLPTPEAFERLVPYLFVAVWIVGGCAVLLGRPPAEPAAGQSLRSAVLAGRPAAAALVGGFLAAGLVVGALSAAHGWAWKLFGATPDTADAAFFSERRLRVLYLGLALAAVAALGIDQATARYSAAGHGPPLLGQVLECCAMFGHASGSFLVLAVVCRFDPRRRRALPWIVACVLLAALMANGAKLLVARTRPRGVDPRSEVRATFGGWLPRSAIGQSFPSGDAATAIALALALAALYPAAGRWFFVVAGLVAWQRVACGAHYPSDVLGGAAVSCLAVACCLRVARWIRPHALPRRQ